MLDEYSSIHGKAFEPGTREALATTAAWLGRVATPGRATPEATSGLCVVCLSPSCERTDCHWVPWPGQEVDYATALADMQRRPEARYVDEETPSDALSAAWGWVDGKLVCGADGPNAFEDCNEPGTNERMRWTRVDLPARTVQVDRCDDCGTPLKLIDGNKLCPACLEWLAEQRRAPGETPEPEHPEPSSSEGLAAKLRRLPSTLRPTFNRWRAQLFDWLCCLALVLITACAEQHYGEPEAPFYVHFAAGVDAADRDIWGEAAADLNEPVYATTGQYLFFVASGPARGRCGVEVRHGAELAVEAGGCLTVVRYVPGEFDVGVAQRVLAVLAGGEP